MQRASSDDVFVTNSTAGYLTVKPLNLREKRVKMFRAKTCEDVQSKNV
jgi:hypothetical protein